MAIPEKCIVMLEKEASVVDGLLVTTINKMAAYSTRNTEPLKAIIEHVRPFSHSVHLGGETLCKLRDIMVHKFTHYDVCTRSILEYDDTYKIKVVTGDVAVVEEGMADEDGITITRHIDKPNIEFLQAFGNGFIAVKLYPAASKNESETGTTVSQHTDKSIYPNDIMFVPISLVEWA